MKGAAMMIVAVLSVLLVCVSRGIGYKQCSCNHNPRSMITVHEVAAAVILDSPGNKHVLMRHRPSMDQCFIFFFCKKWEDEKNHLHCSPPFYLILWIPGLSRIIKLIVCKVSVPEGFKTHWLGVWRSLFSRRSHVPPLWDSIVVLNAWWAVFIGSFHYYVSCLPCAFQITVRYGCRC